MTTGNLSYGTFSPSVPGIGFSKTWNGGNSPNPNSRSENSYTMNLTTQVNGAVTYYDRRYPSWSNNGTALSYCGFAGGTTNWSANDDIALIGKLREKIAGSTFNAAVSAAELPQSLGMIFNAAKRIDQAYRAARKGNFRKAADVLSARLPDSGSVRTRVHKTSVKKTIANNWLELQYGWLPLLNDAYEGAVFLANQLNSPRRLVVYARHWANGKVQTGAPTLFQAKGSCRTDGKIKAILTEPPNTAKLAGLSDPASVLWEKLPYSFVVDWFIPIGDYLQARALSGILSGQFVTTKVTRTYITEIQPLAALEPIYIKSSINYKKTQISLTRTVSGSLSVPLPQVKNLMEIPSWRRAANAVSLLIQRGR